MKYLHSRSRLQVLSDMRAVEIFLSLVETENLTKTAEALSIAPSTVSKKIAELELRAQVRLFHRTTRQISVTPAGRSFYEECIRLLGVAESVERSLNPNEDDPAGIIRLTVPVALGERVVGPLLPEFLRRYPRISVELDTSARTLSLLSEGYDLSIRLTHATDLTDEDTVLSWNQRRFYASPDYLEKYGTPAHPSELSEHSCLTMRLGNSAESWSYTESGRTRSVNISGSLRSNNAPVLASAAAEGLGIILMGSFVVDSLLEQGRLVRILPGFEPRDTAVAAIVSDGAIASHHVNLFIAYLKSVWPLANTLNEESEKA
ncbi:LysR family transcriptional regulator [Brucella anthropi]|uniref:LysR family transcriptional regulator n=1 Tax=Brucella anthropi TaxID=529 RepID=A0A6I0DIV6_BRUAN|nr:LysR family transcriptional regulator [Brucella anthropi]KAB2790321.1 LysR family transcriptional regulator [Brucella anthropi]